MRKRQKGRKLSRKRNQRKALLRSLLGALFLQEKITTTEAKAREMAPLAEKYITRAKGRGLADRRMLGGIFPNKVVKKLMDEIAPRYEGRKGGYTRVTKIGSRKTDGATIAVIELLK